MKKEYLNFFKETLKVEILEPHGTSNERHAFLCLLCDEKFEALPKDRKNKYKKRGSVGCPTCARREGRKSDSNSVIEKLKNKGYIIHGKYLNNKTPIEVEKADCCGRTWMARADKLLQQYLSCKPCRESSISINKNTCIEVLENEALLLVKNHELSIYKNQQMQCGICENTFEAVPFNKYQKFKTHHLEGCADCTRYFYHELSNIEDYFNYLKEKIKLEVLPPFKTSNDIHTIKCMLCENQFEATPKSKMINFKKHEREGCPFCTKKSQHNEFKLSYGDTFSSIEAYRFEVRYLTDKNYKENKNLLNKNNVIRGPAGDPDSYHLDHIYPINYCFYYNVPPEYCAHIDNLQLIPWEENIKKRHLPLYIPDIIKPYIPTAHMYDSFYNKLKEEFNNEKIIKNKIIFTENNDIFNIPFLFENHNLGIIFIPFNDYLYQNINSKKYFKNLYLASKDNGIHTIFIYEDEWYNKQNLILTKIKYKLNYINNKIYARNCIIKEIDSNISNKFLKKHHIQGGSGSKIKLGAFYNDELVSVMSFAESSSRAFIRGEKKLKNWELVRFASHEDYIIIGIASKLLKYFIRNYDWNKIESYADCRWSLGNLYSKIGFTFKSFSDVGYFYIVDGKRKHRWGFRKDELRRKFSNDYDPSKTEYENMLKLGYDRLYDCGHLKYIMKNVS